VTDQVLRASESFGLNLAEGARWWSAAKRQPQLDYAMGSALECAACLDLAEMLNLAEANGRYASGERRHLFEGAESAVVRVGTYLELCARTDKLDPEPKACDLALLDRIASMLRGSGSG